MEFIFRADQQNRGNQKCNNVAEEAFLEGRYNVSFEDVRFVAYPALRHRLALNFEAISDGVTADTVVAAIVDSQKE